jgi:hypothetical protein
MGQHTYWNEKLADCRRLRPGTSKLAREKEIASKTALLEHAIEFNHTFDPQRVKILHQCTNFTKLSVLEMLYINDDAKTVNNRRDIAFLSSAYSNVLRMIKEERFNNR